MTFIRELVSSYSPILYSAFLEIGRFSDDHIIQPNEAQVLNESEVIFTYNQIENASGIDTWSTSETKAFLETLDLYKTYIANITIDQNSELNNMMYNFSYHQYNYTPGQTDKKLEYKALLWNINPYDKYSDSFNQVFSKYSINSNSTILFLEQFAHTIWLEGTHSLPWSIKDYSLSQLNQLIDPANNYELSCSMSDQFMLNMTPGWVDGYFPALSITSGSSNTSVAVERVINYGCCYFDHLVAIYPYTFAQEWNDDYGLWCPNNPSSPPYWACMIVKVGGCHTFADIAAGLCRSINIPASETHFWSTLQNLNYSLTYEGQHGIFVVPSLDIAVHGDEMYYAAMQSLYLKTGISDFHSIIHTQEQMTGWLTGEDTSLRIVSDKISQLGLSLSSISWWMMMPTETKTSNGWQFYAETTNNNQVIHNYIINTTVNGTFVSLDEFVTSMYPWQH